MKTKETTLNMTVVPEAYLRELQQEIGEVKNILIRKSEEEINSKWIESVKIPKQLGISSKTWQTYRDKRLIPFSQIGSKIYVKREDLEKFMQAHYIEAVK